MPAYVDAPVGAPSIHVGNGRRTATTEAEIAPHVNGAHIADHTDHDGKKRIEGERCEVASKWNRSHGIHARGGEQRMPVRCAGQPTCGTWRHNNIGIRVEGERDGGHSPRVRIANRGIDERAVPSMKPVEGADRDRAWTQCAQWRHRFVRK